MEESGERPSLSDVMQLLDVAIPETGSHWNSQLWAAICLLLFGLIQVQFWVSFPDNGIILTNRVG